MTARKGAVNSPASPNHSDSSGSGRSESAPIMPASADGAFQSQGSSTTATLPLSFQNRAAGSEGPTSAPRGAQSRSTVSDRPRPELPRVWTLPEKPKPGRKAATDVPSDRRKASNRNAQRAFRERKRQKLEVLQNQINLERQQAQQREALAAQEHSRLQREIAALQQAQRKLSALPEVPLPATKRHLHAQPRLSISGGSPQSNPPTDPQRRSQAFHDISPPLPPPVRPARSNTSDSVSNQSTTSSNVTPGAILPLPERDTRTAHGSVPNVAAKSWPVNGHESSQLAPLQNHNVNTKRSLQLTQQTSLPETKARAEDMEIDFTTTRQSVQSELSVESPNEDPCGFCAEGTYCVCREDAAASNDRVEAANDIPPQPMEPQTNAVGPGSCDLCQVDPLRRRMCLDIASRQSSGSVASQDFGRSISAAAEPLPLGLHPPVASAIQRHEPARQGRGSWPDGYVSCEDAITMARAANPNFPNSPLYPAWISGLKTIPHQHEDGCRSKEARSGCSAQDVEIASILQGMRGEDDREKTEQKRPVDIEIRQLN